MLRGLTTVSFWADDVIAARDWYAEVLGIEPYFQRPEEGPLAYIEFRIGADEDELGLIDRRYAPPIAPRDPGGAVIYWQVDDVPAAVDRLLELGATEYQPVDRTRDSRLRHGLRRGPVRQRSGPDVQPALRGDAGAPAMM